MTSRQFSTTIWPRLARLSRAGIVLLFAFLMAWLLSGCQDDIEMPLPVMGTPSKALLYGTVMPGNLNGRVLLIRDADTLVQPLSEGSFVFRDIAYGRYEFVLEEARGLRYRNVFSVNESQVAMTSIDMGPYLRLLSAILPVDSDTAVFTPNATSDGIELHLQRSMGFSKGFFQGAEVDPFLPLEVKENTWTGELVLWLGAGKVDTNETYHLIFPDYSLTVGRIYIPGELRLPFRVRAGSNELLKAVSPDSLSSSTPPQTSISLRFREPVDVRSVARHFRLEPQAVLSVTSLKAFDTLVVLAVEGALQPNRRYAWTLDSGYVTRDSLRFGGRRRGWFHTDIFRIDYNVSSSWKKTLGIGDSLVTIRFNAEIDTASISQAFRLDVPGQVRAWARGQEISAILNLWELPRNFTLTLDSTLRAVGGEPLFVPYRFRFTLDSTDFPGSADSSGSGSNSIPVSNILSQTPEADALMATDNTMRIRFRLPVRQSMAESLITVDPPMLYTIDWETSYSAVNRSSLTIRPAQAMRSNTEYKVALGPVALQNGNTMRADTVRFRTAPLRVEKTTPFDGQVDADTLGHWLLEFNTPVDLASLDSALVVEPRPDSLRVTRVESFSAPHKYFQVWAYTRPGTEYRVTLGTGLRDRYGIPMPKAYHFTFRTR